MLADGNGQKGELCGSRYDHEMDYQCKPSELPVPQLGVMSPVRSPVRDDGGFEKFEFKQKSQGEG